MKCIWENIHDTHGITNSPRDSFILGCFYGKLITYYNNRYCTFYIICLSIGQSYNIALMHEFLWSSIYFD